jgi:hypothetical protein
MIAPIKKTQAASGSSSSQVSATPLRVCEARRGVDAFDFCVAERAGDADGAVGDGDVDGTVDVVDGEDGADVVGVGVLAVGASGNC